MAPPANASIRLSVSNCRITRNRDAPSAVRIAISFCRVAALASSKFATFAQAISKTKLTAPNNSNPTSGPSLRPGRGRFPTTTPCETPPSIGRRRHRVFQTDRVQRQLQPSAPGGEYRCSTAEDPAGRCGMVPSRAPIGSDLRRRRPLARLICADRRQLLEQRDVVFGRPHDVESGRAGGLSHRGREVQHVPDVPLVDVERPPQRVPGERCDLPDAAGDVETADSALGTGRALQRRQGIWT